VGVGFHQLVAEAGKATTASAKEAAAVSIVRRRETLKAYELPGIGMRNPRRAKGAYVMFT
jgi:hypothetical protein